MATKAKTKTTAKTKAAKSAKVKGAQKAAERTIVDKTMEQLCTIFNLSEGDTEKFMAHDDSGKAEAIKASMGEISAEDFEQFSDEAKTYLKELGYKTEDEKAEALTSATASGAFTKETAVSLAILMEQDEFELGDIVSKSTQLFNKIMGKAPAEASMEKIVKKMIKLFTNSKVKFISRSGDTFKVNPEMYLALKVA